MTTTTKKSTMQLLASLNWCSRTELAIASLVWLITFGTFLHEPGVEIPESEIPNFFLVLFWCSAWSLPAILVPRWIRKILKGIKWLLKWLWTKAIQKLDK